MIKDLLRKARKNAFGFILEASAVIMLTLMVSTVAAWVMAKVG